MTTNTSNTVSMSKGSLVLSLPAAAEPVVWRMDLKQAQAASFTVKEDNKKWALVKKDQSGEDTAIALFETKEDAMEILMQVSGTLQGGKANTAAGSTAPASAKSEAMKWGVATGGVVLVILLFFYLAQISPQTANPFMDPSAQNIRANAGSPEATGVPVSADAFLSGQ